MSSKRFLDLRIDITPKKQEESRIHPNGKFLYTPPSKKEYMAKISRALSHYNGYFEGCRFLRLKIIFACERPMAAPETIPSGIWKTNTELYKSSAPDIDNYLKPFQDSISNHIIDKIKDKEKRLIRMVQGAGIIDDDAHIVSLISDKIYCRKDDVPHIEFKISELEMFYVRQD